MRSICILPLLSDFKEAMTKSSGEDEDETSHLNNVDQVKKKI